MADSHSSGRPAGNGRHQVNVISWSPRSEIAQLSNFAQCELEVVLTTEDLKLLGEFDSELRITCGSVEGFVQGLKTSSPAEQNRIALLHGKDAKRAGGKVVEEVGPEGRQVFLMGRPFNYCSPEHRALIEWSIWIKFRDSAKSQEAMRWSGDARLTHNLGKFDPKPGKTSLPKQVLCRILTQCRQMVNGERDCKSFAEILSDTRSDALQEHQFYQPLPKVEEAA